MDTSWSAVAERAAGGLGVAAGEVVLVRDHTGRPEVVLEALLAIERRGATPLPEITPPSYLRRLFGVAPVSYLQAWDRHRLGWMRQADRVLVLEGEGLDLAAAAVPAPAVDAWRDAVGRLVALEEERRLPFLLVAVPMAAQAAALGMALPELEAAVLPALAVDAGELRQVITRMLAAVAGGRILTIRTQGGCELRLALGDRRWLDDDGDITDEDRARGGVVSNLPAGSIYTTVLEDRTRGTLRLARAEGATEATLRFVDGVITEVVARAGAEELSTMLDRQTGDARRVGHVGIGLNPRLRRPLGWTLVDEHVHGCLFVSLGENRYMGGRNESSLNVDFAVPGATLLLDDRVIVQDGVVVV